MKFLKNRLQGKQHGEEKIDVFKEKLLLFLLSKNIETVHLLGLLII